MSIYVPRTGQKIALEAMVNKTAAQDLYFDLYSASITPADTDTAATYTPVAGGGYVQKSVAGSTWTTAAASTPTSMASSALTWTFTGTTTAPGTVYGYYVRQQSSGILLYAEAESLFTPTTNGDSIAMTPTLTGTHT